MVQAVGPEIIEILDTDDEDFRPTPLVSHPSRAPIIQVSSLDAVASSLSKKKKEKVSSSKEKTSSTPQLPSMDGHSFFQLKRENAGCPKILSEYDNRSCIPLEHDVEEEVLQLGREVAESGKGSSETGSS